MNKDKEDRIRVRAFEIWQKSGQPEGSHDDHGHQATREIDAEDGIGTSPATEQVAPAWAPDPELGPTFWPRRTQVSAET